MQKLAANVLLARNMEEATAIAAAPIGTVERARMLLRTQWKRPWSEMNVSKKARQSAPRCLLTFFASRGYLPKSSFYEAGWLELAEETGALRAH